MPAQPPKHRSTLKLQHFKPKTLSVGQVAGQIKDIYLDLRNKSG